MKKNNSNGFTVVKLEIPEGLHFKVKALAALSHKRIPDYIVDNLSKETQKRLQHIARTGDTEEPDYDQAA